VVVVTVRQRRALDADLADPELYRFGPPHDVFDALREYAPVRWQATPFGTPTGGFWSLTRHDDIASLSRNREDFTVIHGCAFPSVDRVTIKAQTMFNDAPVHTRLRRIATRSFTPRVIAHFETWIRTIVNDVLDTIATMDRFDFVHHVSEHIPGLVIADVLGVPRDRRQFIADTANNMVEAMINIDMDTQGTAKAAAPMFDYAFELRDLKRREPAEDVVTELVNAPEQLTDDEFKTFVILLVSAGFETTYTAMSQGMRLLVENPDIEAQVADQLAAGGIDLAVEEILRYTTPVREMARTAKHDTEIRGQKIAKDKMVVMWCVAGNRDPEVFENPHRFDAARSPNPHQSFGAGGAHFCLGAPMAHLEIRLLFEEIYARGMKFELNGEPVPHANHFMNRLRSLPLVQV
jgi:cytochrome P450